MNDAALVRVMHGPGKGLHQRGCFPLRQRRAGNFLGEAAARNVFKREKGSAVVLAHLIDLHDVWMLQAGHGLGLGAKSNPRCRVSVGAAEDHFERHETFERTLAGFVHNTHASSTQFRDDLVTRQGRKVYGGFVATADRLLQLGDGSPRSAEQCSERRCKPRRRIATVGGGRLLNPDGPGWPSHDNGFHQHSPTPHYAPPARSVRPQTFKLCRSRTGRQKSSRLSSTNSCSSCSGVGFSSDSVTSSRSSCANFSRARCRICRTPAAVKDLPSRVANCSAICGDR